MSSGETEREIRKIQKKIKITTTDPDEEPKTYVNFYCCKLSLNILFTLSYVTCAVLLNILNRVVFYTYHFNKYNFTYTLLQQIFCIVFVYIVSHKSETFKSQAGEISFRDFLQLKGYYITFAIIFILNALFIFYGTQMIVNAAMFQTLRKLVLVIVYFIDLFSGSKKITIFTSICVFLVTFGGILTGVDTFSRDYFGIFITMVSNMINVAYNKFTESFRRRTGVSNLKLLVYNSYLAGPILFSLIFISGEYTKVYTFFSEKLYLSGENKTEGSFSGFAFSTFLCCALVIVLNSSFFMSNEKNTSLFTILLSHTKDLFTSILSYFFLAGNEFTVKIAAGLLISTTGGVMFSSKSICDNMITGRDKKNPHLDSPKNELKDEPQVVEIKSSTNEEKNNIEVIDDE
jgi:hypothetical protein